MENSVKYQWAKLISGKIIDYLRKDPYGRIENMIRFASFLDIKKKHGRMFEITRKTLADKQNRWSTFYESLFTDLDEKVLKKLVNNLILKGILTNSQRIRNRQITGIPIPWAILMDPTSSCNLKCMGCWVSEYGKNTILDFEMMDRIINEGKAIGTYFYLFSGGEPLLRKNDLIRLCEKHQDCYFSCFTNGTLIDEEFAKELRRVGNFAPALSIEGFEKETDFRRGNNTFQKVIRAMEILRDQGILFGCSTCYHRQNTEVLASDEFIEFVIAKGCRFAWYFTYMPVGKSSKVELIATPDQRKLMYYRLREIRKEKPLFIVDFWNDGEYANGCIAAGRRYIHINSNGDVEPCAFIHYSGANIKDVSLQQALSQPLFLEYQRRQPFNINLLQPCPCLDNPNQLREMVTKTKAKSTQVHDRETVEELVSKCEAAAIAWSPVAEELMKEKVKQVTGKINDDN